MIDNGIFDAAALAYKEEELEALKGPDRRPRVWLLMDWGLACKLSGYQS